MHVVIRTDASIQIGSGHVMRCLTLADELRGKGANITFICREHAGHLCDLIASNGYRIVRLENSASSSSDRLVHSKWLGVSQKEDAQHTLSVLTEKDRCDWLIVDHYALDFRWESLARPKAARIMVIDDLADRKHDCDLLLDQNYFTDLENRYTGLIPEHCRTMLGPKFALLRPEFGEARKHLRQRDGSIKRILVFFGGADPANETAKALAAIQKLDRRDIAVDVVIGTANPHRAEIERKCSTLPNTNFHCQITNINELMAMADLAIGAGGGTNWERACIGLPSIVLGIAENQRPIIRDMANDGLIIGITHAPAVNADDLLNLLKSALMTPHLMKFLSTQSLQQVDGLGVKRVGKALINHAITLRAAVLRDCEKLFLWRNHAKTREFFFDAKELDFSSHKAWFQSTLQSSTRELLVGQSNGQDIGVLRFDYEADRALVSIYLDPSLHGHGFGANLVRSGIQWVRTNHDGIRSLSAEIIEQNIPSKKIFSEAGFKADFSRFTFDLKK